jgi:GT2 family glycosyltransferase
MPQPSVSLVLPNMNNEPILDEFFIKLARNTTYGNVEVVVVDDGSTDGSIAILRRWQREGPWSGFTLIEQENAGVVRAFNRALAQASGDVIVRLDGDATIETHGWLERMLAFQATSDQVGVVVAKIVFDSGHIHSLGRTVVHPDGLHDRGTRILERRGRRTLDSAVARPLEADALDGDRVSEVDAALGCCTLFRREVAHRVGGLDPLFSPVWVEDDDFALGVRREGWKVFCLPEVRVVHHQMRRNPRQGPIGKRSPAVPRRLVGLVPHFLKRPLAARMTLSREAPWRLELLARHYASWFEKWGFDPLNPDLNSVRRRWGGSEVCWAGDHELSAAGRTIAAAYKDASGN